MQDYILPSTSLQTTASLAETSGNDYQSPTHTLSEIAMLKHQYSSLIIQIDKMRSSLLHRDTTFRPESTKPRTSACWSIRQHLGFLIHSDQDIWYPRIASIVREDTPTFEEISIEALVESHHWQETPIENIIGQLMRVRWNASSLICGLPEESFTRKGIHPVHGAITLHEILQHIVDEDSANLSTVRRLLMQSATIEIAQTL